MPQLNYHITPAQPSDASAISSLFAQSWTSPFLTLQFGPTDPCTLASTMTPRIAQQIRSEKTMYYSVARCTDTGYVISVAQWSIIESSTSGTKTTPETEKEKDMDMDMEEEHDQFAQEIFLNSLPSTSNKSLILEFTRGLQNLKNSVLQHPTHSHIVLENVATRQECRGRGVASALVQDMFPMADERGLVVYLDVAGENEGAMRIYERLGFEERGRHAVKDLGRFVDEGEESGLERLGVGREHVHVAMVRYPVHK